MYVMTHIKLSCLLYQLIQKSQEKERCKQQNMLFTAFRAFWLQSKRSNIDNHIYEHPLLWKGIK